MKRLRIKDVIHIASKTLGRYTSTEMYTWGDVKKEINDKGLTLGDTDILVCGFEEGEEYDSSSGETTYSTDRYKISIIRYREETDEEMEKRRVRMKTVKEMHKNIKYQEYLKLKEQFEPNGSS